MNKSVLPPDACTSVHFCRWEAQRPNQSSKKWEQAEDQWRGPTSQSVLRHGPAHSSDVCVQSGCEHCLSERSIVTAQGPAACSQWLHCCLSCVLKHRAAAHMPYYSTQPLSSYARSVWANWLCLHTKSVQIIYLLAHLHQLSRHETQARPQLKLGKILHGFMVQYEQHLTWDINMEDITKDRKHLFPGFTG